MKILLTCFLLFNLIVSHAKEIKWNEGSLVLQTREVLTGKFAIDPYHDLILHQQADNRVNIYNAHQVHALYFYDVDENINRKFVSINQPVLSFKKYHLYEMVVFGEMTVVRKIKALAVDSDARDYDYFVKQDASLIPLREFRDKVYPELTYKLGPKLKDFIRNERLNPNDDDSAIRIILFYNKYVNDNFIIAMN